MQMKTEQQQSALQNQKILSVQVQANQAAECDIMLIMQIFNLKCLFLVNIYCQWRLIRILAITFLLSTDLMSELAKSKDICINLQEK